MRVLDLFSGIGGFSLGLERAGMQTVAFCEIEPFCRAVLKKHWPDVPQYEDIRMLKGEQVGPVDLVCGGYPCQPFSTAGERRGAEDDRHLWPEMRRLVEELRPAWVLGENVAGHITLGLDQVLSDLDALGYATRAFVIPAVAVDAPHRRDRVWIVAHADSAEREARGAIPSGDGQSIDGQGWAALRGSLLPNASSFGLEKQGGVGKRERPTQEGNRQANHAVDGCRWPAEPRVGRVAPRVPQRVDRLKALGNSVVPQVVELIGKAIMEAQRDY